MDQVLRPDVMDDLVGFLTKNIASQDVTGWEFLPNSAEMENFPALRLEQEDGQWILRNMAVEE